MDLTGPIANSGFDYLKHDHDPESLGYWVNPSGQVGLITSGFRVCLAW